jgi:hypothetical protein
MPYPWATKVLTPSASSILQPDLNVVTLSLHVTGSAGFVTSKHLSGLSERENSGMIKWRKSGSAIQFYAFHYSWRVFHCHCCEILRNVINLFTCNEDQTTAMGTETGV